MSLYIDQYLYDGKERERRERKEKFKKRKEKKREGRKTEEKELKEPKKKLVRRIGKDIKKMFKKEKNLGAPGWHSH